MSVTPSSAGAVSSDSNPVTQAHGDSPSAGTSAEHSRADHQHGMPAAGGLADAIAEANFVAGLESIGELDFLIWDWPAAGTSVTSDDRHGVTITPVPGADSNFNAFDTVPAALGNNGGMSLSLNGTDERATTPNIARFSYGNGAAGQDTPFTVVALVKPDQVTAKAIAVSIFDTTGGDEEWYLGMEVTNAYPQFVLHDDDGGPGIIGREDQTALTVDTWTLLAGSYDGSAASPGVQVHKDGAKVDDADFGDSGTYTAMEDGTELLTIGCDYAATTAGNFWSGEIAFVAIFQKELTTQDHDQIKNLVNAFYENGVAL